MIFGTAGNDLSSHCRPQGPDGVYFCFGDRNVVLVKDCEVGQLSCFERSQVFFVKHQPGSPVRYSSPGSDPIQLFVRLPSSSVGFPRDHRLHGGPDAVPGKSVQPEIQIPKPIETDGNWRFLIAFD